MGFADPHPSCLLEPGAQPSLIRQEDRAPSRKVLSTPPRGTRRSAKARSTDMQLCVFSPLALWFSSHGGSFSSRGTVMGGDVQAPFRRSLGKTRASVTSAPHQASQWKQLEDAARIWSPWLVNRVRGVWLRFLTFVNSCRENSSWLPRPAVWRSRGPVPPCRLFLLLCRHEPGSRQSPVPSS